MKYPVKSIPISQIIVDPDDNLSRGELNKMNPIDCEGLARTIERVGLINPVSVKEVEGEDRFRLSAGFRRYGAIALILRWKEIDCRIFPFDAPQKLINAIENLHQKERTFWEECKGLWDMYPIDTPMVQMQADLGMSKTWINTRWKAQFLPDHVKASIEAGIFGFSDVVQLIQKNVDKDQVAAKIRAGKAVGKSAKQIMKDTINRNNPIGKKRIQQLMTKCLKMQRMEAVQALRVAIGEIEEKTFVNWLYDNKPAL